MTIIDGIKIFRYKIMDTSILTKSYNIFAMLFCVAITLIAVFVFIFPIDGYFITPPYNEQKSVLRIILVMILATLVFIPQPIALIGYYLASGIGKKWFSHIIFGLLVLSLFLVFLTIVYLVYVNYTIVPADDIGDTVIPTDFVKYIIFLLIFSNFFVFPVTFTIIALVLKKVSLWKRLLPVISLVSSFVVAVIFAILIYAIGAVTQFENIYRGMKNATIPQFVMLGSAAWALVGLVAFVKNKKVLEK